jgi:hypothetical protein
MTIFTRDGLLDMLRHNVVNVTFIAPPPYNPQSTSNSKEENGEERVRVIACTLQPSLVPHAPSQNGRLLLDDIVKGNDLVVWDVNVQGWRTFNVGRVKNISIG